MQCTCELCGAPFEKIRGAQRYCSKGCQKAAANAHKREMNRLGRRKLKTEKPTLSIDEAVRQAMKNGTSYGKYINLIREGEKQ